MSAENKQTSSNSIKYVQAKMSDTGCIRTCRNCEFVDLDKNICTKYNATPPISVVTTGCDNWQLVIPF